MQAPASAIIEDKPISVATRITLLLTSTLTVMAGAIMTPSVKAIQIQFADMDQVVLLSRLILTSPAIAIAISAPFAGWFADRFGRVKLLITGLLLYAISGTTGLWLNDLYLILVGRLFLGLSVAFVMTAATTLIADYLHGAARQRFLGLQAAAMAMGGMVFLMGGGLLASISWRGPFAVYFAALLMIPLALITLKEPDLRQEANANTNTLDASQNHTRVIPTVILIYFLACTSMLFFYLLPTDIDAFLQEQFKVSPIMTGIAMSVLTISGTAFALLYHRIRARLSYLAIGVVMYLAMAVGYIILGMAPNYYVVLIGMIICGVGIGATMPNSNVWLSEVAPKNIRGRLIGGLNAVIFLGQFSSPAFSTPIEAYFNHAGLFGMYAIAAYVLLALTLITWIILLITRSRENRASITSSPN